MYLAAFDKPARGVIDSGTPAYSGLSLWTDLDHDGQSQDSELQSLAHAGIESISLAAKTVSEEVNGNIITRRSVAIRRGSKGLEEREIVTVKLNISK
jgi:hypothetical protein